MEAHSDSDLCSVQLAADEFSTTASESEGYFDPHNERPMTDWGHQESNFDPSSSLPRAEYAADVFTTTASETDSDNEDGPVQMASRESIQSPVILGRVRHDDSSSLASAAHAADEFTTTTSESDIGFDQQNRRQGRAHRTTTQQTARGHSSLATVEFAADDFTTTASEDDVRSTGTERDATGQRDINHHLNPDANPTLLRDLQRSIVRESPVASSTTGESESESDADTSNAKLIKKGRPSDSDTDEGGNAASLTFQSLLADLDDFRSLTGRADYDPMSTVSSTSSDVTVYRMLKKLGVNFDQASEGGSGNDISTVHDESIFSGSFLSSEFDEGLSGPGTWKQIQPLLTQLQLDL